LHDVCFEYQHLGAWMLLVRRLACIQNILIQRSLKVSQCKQLEDLVRLTIGRAVTLDQLTETKSYN